MDDPKITQIQLKEELPTGISSVSHGSKINGMAFNLDLIASKNPTLAARIIKDYNESFQISPDDPTLPDEDFSTATDILNPPKN